MWLAKRGRHPACEAAVNNAILVSPTILPNGWANLVGKKNLDYATFSEVEG